MKKLLCLLALISVVCVVGCEKVEEKGAYKEGTYFGYNVEESHGEKYVSTAVIYVGENGKIENVFIDSTYTKDGVNTTKKVLGDDYGMKSTSANMGNIEGGAEWYEQIKVLEGKVVAEQGIDWLVLNDSNKTDAVSGVTITVDGYQKALANALKNAK